MTTSNMGIHSASMGGIWQCVVYGFGGVRIVGSQLHLAPRLPHAWKTLSFPLTWHGCLISASADSGGVQITNNGLCSVSLLAYGTALTIPSAATVYTKKPTGGTSTK